MIILDSNWRYLRWRFLLFIKMHLRIVIHIELLLWSFAYVYLYACSFYKAVLKFIFTQLQTVTFERCPREPLFSCVYFRPISSSTGAVTDVNTLLKGTLTVVTEEEESVPLLAGGVGIQICNLLRSLASYCLLIYCRILTPEENGKHKAWLETTKPKQGILCISITLQKKSSFTPLQLTVSSATQADCHLSATTDC